MCNIQSVWSLSVPWKDRPGAGTASMSAASIEGHRQGHCLAFACREGAMVTPSRAQCPLSSLTAAPSVSPTTWICRSAPSAEIRHPLCHSCIIEVLSYRLLSWVLVLQPLTAQCLQAVTVPYRNVHVMTQRCCDDSSIDSQRHTIDDRVSRIVQG